MRVRLNGHLITLSPNLPVMLKRYGVGVVVGASLLPVQLQLLQNGTKSLVTVTMATFIFTHLYYRKNGPQHHHYVAKQFRDKAPPCQYGGSSRIVWCWYHLQTIRCTSESWRRVARQLWSTQPGYNIQIQSG